MPPPEPKDSDHLSVERAESLQLLKDLITVLVEAQGERDQVRPLFDRLIAAEEARLKSESEAREERKIERTREDDLKKERSKNWMLVLERGSGLVAHPLLAPVLVGSLSSAMPWIGIYIAMKLGIPIPIPGAVP